MRRILPISLLALLSLHVCHANAVGGADYSPRDNDRYTVAHSAGLAHAARQVSELYPLMLSEIEDTLGVKVRHDKVHISIVNNDVFRSISGSSAVMAIAIPSESSIVMDYDALRADILVLRSTLKHEIAHMAIHSEGNGNIPKWLDEGISQWASGGHSEIRQGGQSWDISRAALTGDLLPLSSLRGSFPPDEKGMHLSYKQSLNAVDMIVSDYGSGIIADILRDVHSGKSADDSFYIHAGITLDEFTERWKDRIVRRAGIMSFVKAHFYEVIFLIAALALTIGFIRNTYRVRTYRDKEEEEAPLGQDGEPRH